MARLGFPGIGQVGSTGGTKITLCGAGAGLSKHLRLWQSWSMRLQCFIHSLQWGVLRGQKSLAQGYIFIKICSIINSRGTCASLWTKGKSLRSWPLVFSSSKPHLVNWTVTCWTARVERRIQENWNLSQHCIHTMRTFTTIMSTTVVWTQGDRVLFP